MKWQGVMPAITTPFTTGGAIDHVFVTKHVQWLVEHGGTGIVPCGSLGEGATLDPQEKVILSVGHLVERKGFQHIVRALPRIAEAHPAVRLVIVGAPGEEGDFTHGLWTAIREAGVSDRVTLVGAVTHDRLALWYSAVN